MAFFDEANNGYPVLNQEELAQFLLRIARIKKVNKNWYNWTQIGEMMNMLSGLDRERKYWSRRGERLLELADDKTDDAYVDRIVDIEEEVSEEAAEEYVDETTAQEDDSAPVMKPASTEDNVKQVFRDLEHERVLLHDERVARNKSSREEARGKNLVDILKDEIAALPAPEVINVVKTDNGNKAVYAMLSDLHYGLAFKARHNEFNSDIAKQRVLKYANEIINIGHKNGTNTCYVSLMGDLISGNIHTVIRVENRETLCQQLVGAFSVVESFIDNLARNFSKVYVNNVSGNHSRVTTNVDDCKRDERLDDVIYEFVKKAFENYGNVFFVDNEIDISIADFDICGKTYVSVHGDFDNDLKKSAVNIEKIAGKHIDYMLAGHMHVPNMRFENTCYLQNGCVCGSGDNYTMKNRLYSDPYQVCMLCSENGIDAVYPVKL